MIYKMFDGRHIDLSKIVEITPAYFHDRMGSGGWFVGFTILFQLRDTRDTYEYDAEQFVNLPQDWPEQLDKDRWGWADRNVAEPAVAALQKHVDEIIEAWKAVPR